MREWRIESERVKGKEGANIWLRWLAWTSKTYGPL